jgi:hypothetical protein
MKYAVLQFVKSRFEPVFITPQLISYEYGPTVGESFIFRGLEGNNNTSEVKHIMYDAENGIQIITTRNSVYQLQAVLPIVVMEDK